MPTEKTTIHPTYSAMYVVKQLMDISTPCPSCTAGPVPTGDPRSVKYFNQVWDGLDLDAIAKMTPQEVDAKGPEQVEVEMWPKAAEWLSGLIATRSWMWTYGPIPFAKLFRELNPSKPVDTDKTPMRSVSMKTEELLAIAQSFATPVTCKHEIDTARGPLPHGLPCDGPKGKGEVNLFLGAWEAIGLDAQAPPPPPKKGKKKATKRPTSAGALDLKPRTVHMPVPVAEYLAQLLSRRSPGVQAGARRLGRVIAALSGEDGE